MYQYKQLVQLSALTEKQLTELGTQGYEFKGHYPIKILVPVPPDTPDIPGERPYLETRHVFVFGKPMEVPPKPMNYKQIIQMKELTDKQLNDMSSKRYEYVGHYCFERTMPPGPIPKDENMLEITPVPPIKQDMHVFVFVRPMVYQPVPPMV